MILRLIIEGGNKLNFKVKKLINTGSTARDQNQIIKHIEEMEKEGIIVPDTIPIFFPKITDRITTANKIEVLSENTTSGEVEFVLLFDNDRVYIGVGSDHTDRKLEKHSILAAKQICPNVIAKKVWRYEEVRDHWDDIVIRSWVQKDGKRKLYQQACLKTFIEPEMLIQMLGSNIVGGNLNGTIFYAGTIPLIDGEICFSPYFEAQLADDLMGRSISCTYFAEPIGWYKGEIGIN